MADVDKKASQAVARRAGFVQEGVIRSGLPYRAWGRRALLAIAWRLNGDLPRSGPLQCGPLGALRTYPK